MKELRIRGLWGWGGRELWMGWITGLGDYENKCLPGVRRKGVMDGVD